MGNRLHVGKRPDPERNPSVMFYPANIGASVLCGGNTWIAPEWDEGLECVTVVDMYPQIHGLTIIYFGQIDLTLSGVKKGVRKLDLSPEVAKGVIKETKSWIQGRKEAWKFKRLDPDKAYKILVGILAAFVENGFSGGPERVYLVVKKGSQAAGEAKRLEEIYAAMPAIVTGNPEKAVWKLLKQVFLIPREY